MAKKKCPKCGSSDWRAIVGYWDNIEKWYCTKCTYTENFKKKVEERWEK